MATTQKTKDAASRTNPRSNPMMVEANRTKTKSKSAPVISRRCAPPLNGVETTPPENVYERPRDSTGGLCRASLNERHNPPNQAAGDTRLPTCPKVFSLAAAWVAAPRSASGPTRTRYRAAAPDPLDSTNTEKPCPFTWRANLSAFDRLAKLPSCTAHPWSAAAAFETAASVGVVGAGAADSSGADDAPPPGTAPAPVVVPAPAIAPAPAVSPAPASALAVAALGVRCGCGPGAGAGVVAGSGTGALAVARSTVTLRTGSGALMGSLVPTGAVVGPDKSSGAIRTMSTTRIDAPTRRSFTRRSMATASNVSGSGRRSIFGILGP